MRADVGFLAKTLLAIPLIATIFVALVRATAHFGAGWPVHAQHHLLHQVVLFVGFSIVGLFLVYSPLSEKGGWSLLALLITGIAIFGGFWLGHPITGMGEPATVPNTAQAILSFLFVSGLALRWRDISSGKS